MRCMAFFSLFFRVDVLCTVRTVLYKHLRIDSRLVSLSFSFACLSVCP